MRLFGVLTTHFYKKGQVHLLMRLPFLVETKGIELSDLCVLAMPSRLLIPLGIR